MTIGVCHLVSCYVVEDPGHRTAGLIDLSNIDFNSPEKINLGGEWLYYEHVLLFPFEPSSTKPVPTKVPSSLCKRFLNEMGTNIYAQSELSKGTIMIVPLEPYQEEVMESKLAVQYS